MCRQAAFVVKNFKRNDILDILLDMEGPKTGDGFGFCFVKDGKFVSKKTSQTLSDVLKKKHKQDWFKEAFSHDSWVIFHSRNASPGGGGVCSVNAHPFIGQSNALVHNGLFKNHELIKAALGNIKYTSGTDSEVALHFYEKVGPRKFMKLVDDSGVFMFLNLNGELTVIKTNFTSDLKFAPSDNNSIFLASEFHVQSDFKDKEMEVGCAVFDREGKLTKFVAKEKKYSTPIKQTYVYNKGVQTPISNHSETFGHHKSIHEMGDVEWFNENKWNPYADIDGHYGID